MIRTIRVSGCDLAYVRGDLQVVTRNEKQRVPQAPIFAPFRSSISAQDGPPEVTAIAVFSVEVLTQRWQTQAVLFSNLVKPRVLNQSFGIS